MLTKKSPCPFRTVRLFFNQTFWSPYFHILPKHLHFYISIYHPVSMLNCYSCVAVVSILVIRKPTMIYDIKRNVFGNSYLYRCIVTCRLRFVILSRRVSKSFDYRFQDLHPIMLSFVLCLGYITNIEYVYPQEWTVRQNDTWRHWIL